MNDRELLTLVVHTLEEEFARDPNQPVGNVVLKLRKGKAYKRHQIRMLFDMSPLPEDEVGE